MLATAFLLPTTANTFASRALVATTNDKKRKKKIKVVAVAVVG